MLKKVMFLGLMGASLAVNAASITLPSSVELMAFNGVESDDKNKLQELSIGKNQLVIQYIKVLPSGGNKEKLFESKPLVLDINVEHENDSFKLKHRAIGSYDFANTAFKKNIVNWTLSKNSTDAKHVDLIVLPAGEGFFPYNDLEKLIRNYNGSQGIIFETTEEGTKAAVAAVTVNQSGKVEITGDNVSQLKLWYSKADKAERKEFRKWMIDQE